MVEKDYAKVNFERQKELILLKYKLQKELIVLTSKEARMRHLERMEFLVYRDNGIMTERTQKELEINDSLREKVLGIRTKAEQIEYKEDIGVPKEEKLRVTADYGKYSKVYGK